MVSHAFVEWDGITSLFKVAFYLIKTANAIKTETTPDLDVASTMFYGRLETLIGQSFGWSSSHINAAIISMEFKFRFVGEQHSFLVF